MPPRTPSNDPLPVWFYLGTLSLIYGVLLTGAGLYQIQHPPSTVLAGTHATLWAGLILLVIGTIYVAVFWPRRRVR